MIVSFKDLPLKIGLLHYGALTGHCEIHDDTQDIIRITLTPIEADGIGFEMDHSFVLFHYLVPAIRERFYTTVDSDSDQDESDAGSQDGHAVDCLADAFDKPAFMLHCGPTRS